MPIGRSVIPVLPKYELGVIIDPFLTEADHAAEVEKVQEQIVRRGGTVTNIDIWGRRRLSYAIEKKMEGFYVFTNFEGVMTNDGMQELERGLKLNEKVMRQMLIRIPEIKPRKEKVKKPKSERIGAETQYGGRPGQDRGDRGGSPPAPAAPAAGGDGVYSAGSAGAAVPAPPPPVQRF